MGGKSPTSSRGERLGAKRNQEKVRCSRGQDKTGREAKIGKRRGSGGRRREKGGLDERCECQSVFVCV